MCQLHLSKERKVLQYAGLSKPLQDKPTTIQFKGEIDHYFCSIVYLLRVSQKQRFQFR